MATAMSFTTQILKDLGASSGLIGGASIFYMAAAVSSARFASTALCARRGARFYIPLVFLLVTIYCILVPRVGNVAVIFLLQALPGMSNGILLSYLTSESMRDVPEEKKSTAMGLFQAVYAVGMSMFPAVVGALAEHINVAAGSPAVSGSGFADVAADAYYADAVAWTADQGITSGTTAETFSPAQACTRAQIVTFLYRDRA